jgi:hypothetical protein
MQTDNKSLVDCIDKCFALSVNPAIPIDQQEAYQIKGFELRSRLVTLLHAAFADGTAEVVAANAEIASVNQKLKDTVDKLQHIADTIAAVSNLVGTLDSLFKLPFAFM